MKKESRDRIQIVRFGGWNGFEIREDGVWVTEDDVRRKATRREAITIRSNMRWALGEEIANIAGVEPE
jgi:hypothetical protein